MTRRKVEALTSHQRFFTDMMVIPNWHETDSFVAEGLGGVGVASIDTPSPGRWDVVWELPRTLATGQTSDLATRIFVSRCRALSPYLMLAPFRTTSRALMCVEFDPDLLTTAWVVRDTPPTAAALPMAPSERLDLSTGRLEAEFIDPQIGLAYGICWEWAD